VLAALATACSVQPRIAGEPRIEFTTIPEARPGGPQETEAIEGRAISAQPGHRVVLFAKSDVWWVQPLSGEPFTPIDSNFRWKNRTHFGTEYAALLVDGRFVPPAKLRELPATGGSVLAVARARGRQSGEVSDPPKELRFSGFDWDVRSQPSDRGGAPNEYDPGNAWVDDSGRLHLRITKGAKGWRCSEVRLKDSLGYGTYSFTVSDTGDLQPAAVLGFYTYDQGAPGQNNREMDIEVSRWGDPSNKRAQYAVQPYYISANVVRFEAPAGKLKHSMHWVPGRADFQTVEVGRNRTVAKYSFTSGVPSAGEEVMFIALYAYGKARVPLKQQTEVVVDRFEYIP
jgi:hypothetical protein